MTHAPGSVRLDIFADPTCPASLIGHATLDRALAQRPDHPFSPVWHPYRLEPQLPPAGMDFVEYMKAKHKTEAAILAAMRPVMQQAEEMGLWINPSLITRIPDTTNAHRLMLWAGSRQGLVMEGLMSAFWREGGNLADPDLLAKIAAESGLDGDDIARRLRSDEDIDTVLTAEAHARDRGIRELPTVIVADRHAVIGAQPVQLWLDVITDLVGPAPTGPLN